VVVQQSWIKTKAKHWRLSRPQLLSIWFLKHS